MPYVTDDRRHAITAGEPPQNAGELNYLITLAIVEYLDTHGLSYQTCNDVVGALDNAKGEFKRRVQDPYEDQAIQRNGDIGYERYFMSSTQAQS